MIFAKKTLPLLLLFCIPQHIFSFWPWGAQEVTPCTLNGHAGKKPGEVCKMRDFITAYKKYAPNDSSAAYLFEGEPGTVKTSAVDLFFPV